MVKTKLKTGRGLLLCVFLGVVTIGNAQTELNSIEDLNEGAEVLIDEIPTISPVIAPVQRAPDYEITLKQLGARYPFNLRGVEGSDSVEFSIRSDEIVTEAAIDLRYTYSPALLSDYSHINVLLNDEVAVSLPVPKEQAGQNIEKKIVLPPHLITEENRLRLQLIGHYTLECEDPLHSSLWANVSNFSQLSLTTESVRLPDELSLLPLPFFDKKDVNPLNVPFVFPDALDSQTLEAAGIVASWFGLLSEKRGASFPTRTNYPAKGNAIVFTAAPLDSKSLGGVDIKGPMLFIQPNPNDSYGKLLFVVGRNADELKTAAQALVLGSETLSGQMAHISVLGNIKARQPYDAPNWFPLNRPVKLGELVPEGKLHVTGYNGTPIRIPMQLPPDLFPWRAPAVPLDLHYRYTPQIGQTNSALILNTTDRFLRSFPLFSIDQLKSRDWLAQLVQNDMLPVKTQVDIPLERLLSKSELEFRFMYNYIKEGECRDIIIDNVRGFIDPESTIDLTGYSHFIPMPNLGVFGQAGFPFTRMADLSETTVVLSPDVKPEEVAAYLRVLGHFGSITGYPATGVEVAFGKQGLTKARDTLLIAAGEQEWLAPWLNAMPARIDGDSKQFILSDLVYKVGHWLGYGDIDQEQSSRTNIQFVSSGKNTFFAGFESPIQSKRSVVVMASSDTEGLALATEKLIQSPSDLAGSLAILKEGNIEPLVFEPTYYLGELPILKRIEWELAKLWPSIPPIERLLVWLGLAFLMVLLMAILWRTSTRAKRLKKE